MANDKKQRQHKRNIKNKTENIKQSDRIKATHNSSNSKGNCFKLSCFQEGSILRKNGKTKSNFKTPKENDIKVFQVKGWVKVHHTRKNRKQTRRNMLIPNKEEFKAKLNS